MHQQQKIKSKINMNMREQKKQIQADTLQWVNTQYKVQLITGKSSIKLMKVQKYYHDDRKQKQIRDKGWTEAIVNLTEYSQEYMRLVPQKKIPLQQIIFYGGHVNIHKYSSQPYKIFTFLLCDIRLGVTSIPNNPKYEECDSLLIGPEFDGDAFQYNYILKDYSQYFPKYEVTFTVSDDKQFRIEDFECNNCESRSPTIYCATQKLNFCEQCCEKHHTHKLMQSHALEEIDKINTLDFCKKHNEKYEYFCIQCEKYLCQICTNKGVHSLNCEHPIKPIAYLYDETQQNITVLPNKNLQKIDAMLSNIKIKRKQIQQNEKQIKQAIEREYRTSLEKLENEMSRKYRILNSCELQLGFLKEKIEWARSFAIFQKKNLKPIHYFKSEHRFEDFVKNLRIPDFQPVFLCKPDIVYESDSKIGPLEVIQRQKGTESRFNRHLKQKEEQIQKPNPIFIYNENVMTPRIGDLWANLHNSDLNYFQVK